METLESSRVCRLCGKHSGISINIFDKNENHVRKINAVLPIMVHEMDLLPKHMCHRCSYKLEEFHKFYVDCLRTDADLKSQLSWMRKGDSQERIGVPMVQIGNVKIKAEPLDYEIYELDRITGNVGYVNSMNTMTFPVNGARKNGMHEALPFATYARCGCLFKKDQNRSNSGKAYLKITGGAVTRNHTAATKIETTNDVTMDPAQVVKRNPFRRCAAGSQTSNTLDINRDSRKYKSSTETKETLSPFSGNSLFDRSKFGSVGSPFGASNSSVIRNLRPRKESVDYVGSRKRSRVLAKNLDVRSKSADGKVRLPATTECEPVVQVKIEPLDGTEGRMLRPRTKVVDYRGKKRKMSGLTVGKVRSKSEEVKRQKNSCSDTRNWLPITKSENPSEEDELNFPLQEELRVNNDPSLLASSAGRESKTRTKADAKDSPRKVDALPNNVLIKVEDNISEYTKPTSVQGKGDFNLEGKLQPLVRGRKPGKTNAKRKAKPHFSLKYLRSHDAHLRNGKVKKFENMDLSMKKLRRNWQHIAGSNRTVGKNLFKVIKENVCAKNGTGTEKLIDIKHYCEKCSMTFANKELYRLHACYYD